MPLHTFIQNIVYVKQDEMFTAIQEFRKEYYPDKTDEDICRLLELNFVSGDDFYQWLEETNQRETYED